MIAFLLSLASAVKCQSYDVHVLSVDECSAEEAFQVVFDLLPELCFLMTI